MGVGDAYDCELRLGLPGADESEVEVKSNKRVLINSDESRSSACSDAGYSRRGNAKAQIVGWPPIRSYRKSSLQPKNHGALDASGVYVKVSVDGAPYLRKIDLNGFKGYSDLLKALENMFKILMGIYSEREGYKGSEYEPTYEDKDGDWMLVGDVPWDMFVASCKKLRIMRRSEATGSSLDQTRN